MPSACYANPNRRRWSSFTPHSTNLSSALRKCSGRQSRTVTSPRVIAPASSNVPVTMRSGMISYSVPCSSFDDALDHDRVGALTAYVGAHRDQKSSPSRRLRAPSQRFAASSSLRATTDASIAFLVAPTLGKRNSIDAPCSRRCFDSAIRLTVRVAYFAAKR